LESLLLSRRSRADDRNRDRHSRTHDDADDRDGGGDLRTLLLFNALTFRRTVAQTRVRFF
jgi:hypothetical protein